MQRRSSKPTPQVSAVSAGLRLLARRAHSREEMSRKLSRRGYGPEDVQTALEQLTELGYLDDAAFAEGHVRRRSTSLGPIALSAELAARGIDRGVAGRALAGLDRESQARAAARLAERLCARRRPAGYQDLLNLIGAKLVRRGFSMEIAREACWTVWAGTAREPSA